MNEVPVEASEHVRGFYDRHPISAAQILAKVEAERGSLDGLKPEHLYPYDQDHYGGLAANDALAAAAGIDAQTLMLDVCAGLCGPARYQVMRHGCSVLAIDLTPSRVEGARRLNRLVGLDDRIAVHVGDATALPFEPRSIDVALSQEAFVHIADKGKLLAGLRRVLKPGGRLAFTDWIAGAALSADDRALMWRGIAAQKLLSAEQYRAALVGAGFHDLRWQDLSGEWVPILRERLAMYRRLREEARRDGLDPHAEYVGFYERFVGLIESGRLGGGRFVGTA